MFPIRSLTPQQATGNALASGFIAVLSRNKNSNDHISPSEILSPGNTFGEVGKYPVHSHSSHARNILGAIHRIDKYLETTLMGASHEIRIRKVNAGVHRIRGELSDKFLIRAVETADHNANPDVGIEFLHSS
jgi:hypothetical protein